MKIRIKTISHKKQRYDTVGDYWKDKQGVMQFRISNQKNEKYEFLIMIHELIEWFFAKHANVTEKEITKFDQIFERNRTEKSLDEPGDDRKAPYYRYHQIATAMERLLATMLRLDWNTYEEDESYYDL